MVCPSMATIRSDSFSPALAAGLPGAAVVIASGVYIIYRETVRGVARPPIAPTQLK